MSLAALRRKTDRLGLPLLAACAAWTLLSCTSSGDGGDDLVDDFLETGALYASDMSPGSGTVPYVDMDQSVDQRDRFCVAVSAHRVMSLYSVTFTLSHDPAQVAFDEDSSSVGPFLGSGLLVSLDDATAGEVRVGVTRELSTHGMVGVDGEGVIIDLCYDVVGDGDGRLNFIPNLALEDPMGNPVPNGPPVFVGGDLSTRL